MKKGKPCYMTDTNNMTVLSSFDGSFKIDVDSILKLLQIKFNELVVVVDEVHPEHQAVVEVVAMQHQQLVGY